MNILAQGFVLLGIIGINGFLALSEIALVSSRKSRLQKFADDGHRGARIALKLAQTPTSFLASLQICITILGIGAGAYGGAKIAEPLQHSLEIALPMFANWAHAIAFGFVIIVEGFFMVLLGELIPKRVALFFPERIAMNVAPIIAKLGQVISPASNFFGRLAEYVIRIFSLSKLKDESKITEDEIKILIEQGTTEGVFNKAEESIIKRAIDFPELIGTDFMTPRTRVVSFKASDSLESVIDQMLKDGFSHYPIFEDDQDQIAGVVSIKKAYISYRQTQSIKLRDIMDDPVFIPNSAKAGKIMETMKAKRNHFMILIDEFGSFAGILTATDVLESIVGEVPGSNIADNPKFIQRSDGTWLVDGMVSLFELRNKLEIDGPDIESNDYQTLSGLIMHHLDKVPKEGQILTVAGWEFEILDMDRNRIDKVLISKAFVEDFTEVATSLY
jgi:putative hemolysin